MNQRRFRTSWLRSLRYAFVAGVLTLAAPFAAADAEFAAGWGPDLGTAAPLLNAVDQDGKPQTLESMKGENGLLVVFNRSVDW